MNYELRISILFSVIVKIYNFVVNMPKSGAERTRAWRERKRTSEVTVQNVKKRKNRSELERDSIERNRIRASLDGVNNKDNEPATSTSAQPPLLAPISDNLQYSDFPVIQKFHFSRASLRHTLFFLFNM
jgi:hypothetical protein